MLISVDFIPIMCLKRIISEMEFVELLRIVGDEPIFESSLLFAGIQNIPNLQRQLARWVQAGYLYQLRREVYMLAPPYQKTRPHPFLAANRMVGASYVSGESALAFHGLIPEYVPVITSVTTNRPGHWTNAVGDFQYQHVKIGLFFGYESIQVDGKQHAFVATPEKALLDLIHLRSGGDSLPFLESLRLQHLDRLSLQRLDAFVERADSPKLARAAKLIHSLTRVDAEEYEVLQ